MVVTIYSYNWFLFPQRHSPVPVSFLTLFHSCAFCNDAQKKQPIGRFVFCSLLSVLTQAVKPVWTGWTSKSLLWSLPRVCGCSVSFARLQTDTCMDQPKWHPIFFLCSATHIQNCNITLGGNTAVRFLLLFLEEHAVCLCLMGYLLLCCFGDNKQA